ncbi:hypothetical protein Pint_11373 [Pistacia integerrima]|uniref:Uncharacterized protein n=1 Tax=Pistacia integerrima TaxID=434235 RepID=A0ACC0XHL8_9ROSI|nr:hypothetical protein Pint_11373 [Pistacia integerrima]
MMYQRSRIITSSHKFIFSFKPKFIHTITNSKPLCQNTRTPLATHLGSILEAFSDHPFALQRANKQVHAQFIVNKISTNASLGAKILGFYVLCGSFIDAINMFYSLELRTSLPWNRMIRVFVQMGWFDFALLFYFKMLSFGVVPDNHTFPSVIKACGALDDVRLGRMVHETIRELGFEFDVFVGSSLVKFYAEKGCIDDARCLFDEMSERDCVLWNVMLNGYVKCGELDNAMKVFKEMRRSTIKPNSVTFACVLSVCAAERMIAFGMQLHGVVVSCGLEFDSPVANTLLAMYSKCELLCNVRKLFELMPRIDLVTWNGMIAGHVQNGFMDEALDLFRKMISSGVKPDPITFSSFLPSVAELASLKQGKEIHGYIIRNDVPLDAFLKSALIDLYFKCRDVEMACKIFNQSTTSDVAICTAMISGFVLNEMNNDALKKFRFLIQEKMSPNAVTLASILPAIAGLAALKLGKELHGNILKNRLDRKCQVGSAVADIMADQRRPLIFFVKWGWEE